MIFKIENNKRRRMDEQIDGKKKVLKQCLKL